jgi:hypothetical protein
MLLSFLVSCGGKTRDCTKSEEFWSMKVPLAMGVNRISESLFGNYVK